MTTLKSFSTYTSREFNQDAGGAKRAAEEGRSTSPIAAGPRTCS